MTVPGWWSFTLLALAAYRVFRLIGEDTILDRPRKWLLGLSGWTEGKPTPKGYREELGIFLQCPWCMGFWVTLAWWGAYELSPHWATVVATPWAISAVVGVLGHVFAPE